MPPPKFPSFLLLFRRSSPFNHQLYSTAAANAIADHQQPQFVSIVQSIKNRLQPDTLIHAIDLATSEPSFGFGLALNVFRWASKQRNFHHTADTYAHMILKLGMYGTGVEEEMESLLKEMIRFQIPEIRRAFELLIDNFCRNQKPLEALLVFKNSAAAKQRLSVSICNMLLSSIISSKYYVVWDVLFVYKEMVKLGTLPDVQTLNFLIKSLCDVGRLDLALKQFHAMNKKQIKPDCRTFEIVLAALCSDGNIDYAVKVLDQMIEVQCRPDCQFYNNVIPLFCTVNRFQEATALCKMMKETCLQLNQYLYVAVINCLCKNNQVDVAIELFDEMTSSPLTPLISTIYLDIVDGYCEAGRLEEAASFIDRCDILEVEPHNCLLKAYCNMRMLSQAINYLNEMSDSGSIDSSSWNIVLRGHCEVGHVAKSLEILGRMVVSSYVPEEVTYSAMIIGFCRSRAYEKALRLFRQFHQQNLDLDSQICSELVEGLCNMKKIEEATELVLHFGTKGFSFPSHPLDSLVEEICQNGKINQAIRVRSIVVLNGTTCLPATYRKILLQLLSLECDKYILAFLSQIVVEGFNLDSTTYSALILCLCEKSMTREAALIFNQMVGADLLPNSETLEVLLVKLAEFSQLQIVVGRLDKVMDAELLGPTTCNMIVYSLIKEGWKNDASTMLDRMLEKGWVPDTHTHGLLVKSIDVEEEEDRKLNTHGSVDGDDVSDILAEGLSSLNKHIAKV